MKRNKRKNKHFIQNNNGGNETENKNFKVQFKSTTYLSKSWSEKFSGPYAEIWKKYGGILMSFFKDQSCTI